MKFPFEIPLFEHGGGDVNRALARLSWREMIAGFGIMLAFFALILIIVVLTQ